MGELAALHQQELCSVRWIFEKVQSVLGKAGRATTATDPAPLSMLETLIVLKPRERWRKGVTKDRLIAEMEQRDRENRSTPHILIAVDERFTTPALPLIGIFAGARLSELVGRRQAIAVRYAA